jgi:hypothetical protein
MKNNEKILSDKLTLMVYSDKWTPEMEFMYLIGQKLNLSFLWLRPIVKKVELLSTKNKHRTDNARNKFKIETRFIKDHYSAPILFDMLRTSVEKNSWIFRLDNDEIVSEKSLKIILKTLPVLNMSVSYGMPRLWINKVGKSWFYSDVAATYQEKYDFIYRLFTMNNAGPITGVHSGGVKHKRTRKFDYECFILHLIYLRENLESRCKKVSNYEALSPGSGHSKIRHYLPELYPETIWQSLPKSEVRLIKLFESSNKLF